MFLGRVERLLLATVCFTHVLLSVESWWTHGAKGKTTVWVEMPNNLQFQVTLQPTAVD